MQTSAQRGPRTIFLILASVVMLTAITFVSGAANGLAVKGAPARAHQKCGNGPNILQDGSFDSAPSGGLFSAPNTTAIPFWTIGGDSVNVTGSSDWLAEDGPLSIDLSGDAPGSVSQTINDTSGARYILCFYLGGNFDGGPVTKKMKVLWNSTTVATYTFNTSTLPSTKLDMGWKLKLDNLVGHGTDTLVLENVTSPARFRTAYGAVVDNVSIEVRT